MDVVKAIKFNAGRPYTREMWKAIQDLTDATVDGEPGKQTARAVQQWQRTNGKGSDGMVGRGTFKAMCRYFDFEYLDAYGLDAIIARHPDHTTVLDFSKWQCHDHRNPRADDQDWPRIASAGVKGVYVKMSEHERWGDGATLHNLNGAARVGLPRGAYHVAEFLDKRDGEATSPRAEAENFLRKLDRVTPDLEFPIALDLEQKLTRAYYESLGNSSRAVAGWCFDWVRIVERETGLPVILYMSRHTQKMCQPLAELVSRARWLVDYRANADGLWLGTGEVAKGWTAFKGLRQVFEETNAPGVASSRVDLNLVEGNIEGAALIEAIASR